MITKKNTVHTDQMQPRTRPKHPPVEDRAHPGQHQAAEGPCCGLGVFSKAQRRFHRRRNRWDPQVLRLRVLPSWTD